MITRGCPASGPELGRPPWALRSAISWSSQALSATRLLRLSVQVSLPPQRYLRCSGGERSGAVPNTVLRRDQRLLAADLELLHGPRIPVRIAEAEERAAVALVEHHDLADLDPAIDQLLPRRSGVRDDELQSLDRARRHLALAGEIPEDDRAAGAARRQLHDMHLRRRRVVVELEADLVAIEAHGALDVADRHDDHF